MDRIEFLVKGSASEPYQVVFIKIVGGLTAHCTCQAGLKGSYCKHRIGILEGNAVGIVSANKEHISIVAQWFKGSKLEKIMALIKSKESEIESLASELEKLRKDFAQKMRKAA